MSRFVSIDRYQANVRPASKCFFMASFLSDSAKNCGSFFFQTHAPRRTTRHLLSFVNTQSWLSMTSVKRLVCAFRAIRHRAGSSP
jgi:hypothetical protein